MLSTQDGLSMSNNPPSPGVNGSVVGSLAAVDANQVISYISPLLQFAFSTSEDNFRRPRCFLHPDQIEATLQRCNRFANDPQQQSLFIHKEIEQVDEALDGGDQRPPPSYLYTIGVEPQSAPNIACIIAIFKHRALLDSAASLASQINFLNLPGPPNYGSEDQAASSSQYEFVHSALHNVLGPFFDTSSRSQHTVNGVRGRAEINAKTGIPVTRKRWNELELSLRHLQQNVEIPEVSLPLHPEVQSAIDLAIKHGEKPSIDQLPANLLQDSSFHNSLQSSVNNWIKSIQVVTKMTRETPSLDTGSAIQEINFWLSMESALEGIEEKLRGEGVLLTLDILKQAKRFQATVSFTSDTGLKEAMEKVQKYNQLMRDFPLDELLSATSLIKVRDTIGQIFGHLNKKLRICPYPISRALPLVEAISGDLDEALHRHLPGTELVNLDYAEFTGIMNLTDDIFRTWDENIKEFTNIAREVMRRRNERLIPIKVKKRHEDLQQRLKYVGNFRDNHEQLQRTIMNVLGPKANGVGETDGPHGVALVEEMGDIDAVEEVNQAWESLRNVDVLDVTTEGTHKWIRAENTYNERTSRVENSIIARLRDRLATAKNANEMFHVFSKFNALFVRPKIRGAIAEYQTQLLDKVKVAIDGLKDRFINQYGHSEASAMASLHDLPSVSGAIIWARQIERQLDGYMKKVEAVLGDEWLLQAEGQKLQIESEHFRRKLDTKPIYDAWLKESQRRDITIAGPLFKIIKIRSAGNILELAVNFDQQVIVLFKETRNLVWLNYPVPHGLSNTAKDAKRVYPFAVTLIETVRTFTQTDRKIAGMTDVSVLLHKYQNAVLDLIKQGVPLKWESFVNSYELHRRPTYLPNGNVESAFGSRGAESKHVQFVHDFAATVTLLHKKTHSLDQINHGIEKTLEELNKCPYKPDAFENRLDQIQQSVDKLSLEEYSNLGPWVADINNRIKTILLARLQDSIQEWIRAFEDSGAEDDDFRRKPSLVVAPAGDAAPKVGLPVIRRTIHEITMRNQLIYLDPPLEWARANWIFQLQEWLGVVCNLRMINASRFKMTISARIDDDTRFTDLPAECTDILARVYTSIEKKLEDVGRYVEEWLRFQSLWDLQAERVYEELGEHLPRWLQMIQEIRKVRQTFDTAEVSRSFGHITIDYEQVQSKVNQKYDQWQDEIVKKFATRLASRMAEVYHEIEIARNDLEGHTLEASSTAQAVQFINIVDSCKRKVKAWAPEMETFRTGQSTLQRQRYQFPKDWLHISQVDSMWDALNELLERKSKIVQDQMDGLRAKTIAEDQVVMSNIDDISLQWEADKPVDGKIPPDTASATLSSFETRITKIQEDFDMVAKAKEALNLPANPDNRLATILEEVRDFKSVWANLATIWRSLNDLREMLWTSVVPRKIRSSIDGLIKMTKDMPSRMRQYAAFEHMQNILRQLLKSNSLLSDLRSDAIRERHWQKIFKDLKPGKRYSPTSMTLGDVWDLNLVASEKILRDIIAQASGEMALEEFIRQVRETWSSYSLELVSYQNKCRLIRGWDDLFAKCSENLNSLQAMRHSPYYKQFEEEGTAWEDKLNRVHVLFDVWIDVQRQWVYLEGVFTGNADIKHLLPTESIRFSNINTEFLTVMKKVYKSPYVLDVLNIAGVQKSLERLADLLNKIQKALGEYLEKERQSFPRFYFVGDEDLLEMIGNSNDTMRIAKHFKKMFAGLYSLIMDDESIISGFTSKEGEVVRLKKEISLVKTPKINDWLALLEKGMKNTLAELLSEAVEKYGPIFAVDKIDPAALTEFMDAFPSQIVVLATQVVWTTAVDQALTNGGKALKDLYDREVQVLRLLADTVLGDLQVIQRKKCEQLITECVHQRDVIDKLVNLNASSTTHYMWQLQMRYVYQPEGDFVQRLSIRMANAVLDYGFEYLGVPDRLVRTPLTDRCFLTLTQALCQRLGGSPYGPAGTGKTESVKALGLQLGRFTLVFCCDDTFDFQAMGRIFLGICQVGAWGCFDEFNRLEERILSAVSQQIQNIQLGLKQGVEDKSSTIELVSGSQPIHVNSNTGIFITMNPGYAGRSNLPDNLKKLFRSVAMSKPDKELIAEVMLYSQGFNQAKKLSKQTVPFFDQCSSKLSKQAHYDFGLRALKSVLVSSGGLKRARLNEGNLGSEEVVEPEIIVQSIRETIAPKLIKSDVDIMMSVEGICFPGVQYVPANLQRLEDAIRQLAAERRLVINELWMTKVLQLYQIQNIHHGVMMVGNSGTGKSASWKLLLDALNAVEGVEGVSHVIDSKVMSKEALYGNLDPTTREWTDGLFTSILRKVVDNLRGEDSKRHWIVFDGDVDPEWVENLNSVLDDNKLLTLPNGERLNLPSNVRIMFEVETLKYATLATVSRCGMVWFSEDTVTPQMMTANYLDTLRTVPFEDLDEDAVTSGQNPDQMLAVQSQVADFLTDYLAKDDFITQALRFAEKYNHIMEFTDARVLNTLFSLLSKAVRDIIEYNAQHPDFPLEVEKLEEFVSKKVLLALVWALTGDCPLDDRKAFGDDVARLATFGSPPLDGTASLIDFNVSLPRAEWIPWQGQVPTIEVNTHSVTQTDVVIPTVDTIRHEDVLYSWLAEHKPLLLCGPPGSGKTMTLFSALRKLPNMEVVGLNFSSATTPDLLIKTFEQYCEYKKVSNATILAPTQIGRWLVIFCDEINLPAPDKYGTQRAISFLRQLVEQNGFWRTGDKTWVTLDRIQFVGACNPPTDAGRTPLATRFLRHAPLIMVDYPGELSLTQIYGTFNSAILKIIPTLRGYSDALTSAMVKFYLASQKEFTPQKQPHYVYSPRELTRWVRGVYEAIKPLETLSVEGLVRIWAHEALRLFQDRLVQEEERKWTDEAVRRIALEFFPNIDEEKALGGPILFSNWLSKNYIPVEREELREFVKARLKTFCEEEVDTPLILFNDVLEHVLRIDRVFRQPQGHLILIGVSGSGKTTLSRFVAWMNGLKVFQIKVHGKYSAEDFDDDLRDVLKRCGTKGEKICFIMDESNVLDSGFLERMNTLLANAEVPGLFEGDEFTTLMTACKEGAQRNGQVLDSQEELYKWFTSQIVQNLHVVFTMNPPEEGLSSKAATSPALFNRCVLNWFGDWSNQAFYQVGRELTEKVDLDRGDWQCPDTVQLAYNGLSLPLSHRDTVVNAMVYIHNSLQVFNAKLRRQQGKVTYLTPRHFLDFVSQYVKLYNEKRDDLEEQQRHLNIGLDKLHDTVNKVEELRISLDDKKAQLERKNAEAQQKLQQMTADKLEAEKKAVIAKQIKVELEQQEAAVAERKKIVLSDLAKAEPAVEEAKKSVSNIKKQQLTEVRSMASPPAGVKLALDAVCTLVGHQVRGDWKQIQAVVRRDDFIASIVQYDNEKSMTEKLRNKMRSEFLSNSEFTYEKVNRASKACGPLVQWVKAQVEYSEILHRVGPLREEVKNLEEQALQTKSEAMVNEEMIAKLSESIIRYQEEYAHLVAESGVIKEEMNKVEFKVNRSVRLLQSLESERVRWEQGSKSFVTQIGTLIGDVLVASAFLAYSGLFDQTFRKLMMEDWLHHLHLAGVKFKQNNPVMEYLSTADERLGWQSNSLPVDDLMTENAIILQRFNRYPLIIDPSGTVTEFLQKEHKTRRLNVTSFLDDNFSKQLESALRFGNSILIQDAEHLDPILNHVLNREFQKTGGRVLIQLGKQQIDFSPAFRLYLSTRDPSASFAPDICSRTTFVNFTVTQSSLQTQSLNEVLKCERPDVDERRSNLIKAQGEFNVHLRKLEKSLLQALNESKTNILDDDNVIETLEKLKKDAAEIAEKMSNTQGVMAEVEEITQQYAIIARSCSAVFAVLEQLHYLNHFYHFSLAFFTDIFHTVLKGNKNLAGETNHNVRRDIIVKDLFVKTFKRTALGLLQKDRVTLAILLAQASPYKMDKTLISDILDEEVTGRDVSNDPDAKDAALKCAAKVKALKDKISQVSDAEWDRFLGEELAENFVPQIWDETTEANDKALLSLLLVKLFRLDRFVPAAERFACLVFGSDLLDIVEDLDETISQVEPTRPIALVSSPGFDASYKVQNIVNRERKQCHNLAMGSNEGVAAADKAVANAAQTGTWVLIKNVHLAPTWLQSLEKRMEALNPHQDFRLFLSMESSPKIPVNLLRASRVLMYEQPAGVRANMKDSLKGMLERSGKAPVERTRLYLLLSFLHAVVQERLRYAPHQGWKGFWEFNDSDYDCSAFIIDTWVEQVAHNRTNIAPANIPWDMIRYLVTETYGGKIDDDSDFRMLNQLVHNYLTPAAYENDHKLVESGENEGTLVVPGGTQYKEFMAWVQSLPEREPPTYLGLPANAEKLLLQGMGTELIRNLRKVTELLDEGEKLMSDDA